MKRITTILFLFLCLGFLGWAERSEAADYYVDYEGGDDANSGLSTSDPWQHSPGDNNASGNANRSLQAGDRIIFKGGAVYKGTIDLKWSGSVGSPIIYDGNSAGNWGTGKAIIDGEGDTLGINARKYGFYGVYQSNIGKSHIVIDNFEIQNLRYVYPDNYWEQPIGIFVAGLGSGIEIKNCYLHDIKKKSLGIDTEQGAISLTVDTFTDLGQDFSSYVGTPGQLATHKIKISWLINGAKSDYYQANAYIGGLNGGSASVRVYKDIYLTQPGWSYSTFDPLAAGNSGYFYWVYNLNQGFYNGSGGIGINVLAHSNTLIHDNIIEESKAGIAFSASNGVAADNVQIYNNDISRASWGINATAGGYAGEDLTNLKISDNVIHDFQDAEKYTEYDWGYHRDGVFLFNAGPTDDASIRGFEFSGNFFYGSIGSATALLYLSGNVSDIKIFNNLFASSYGDGYQIRTIGNRNLPSASVHDLLIYNNVFAKIPGENKYSLEFEHSANVRLRNNIFYLFDHYGACFAVADSALSGFSSDYNLLHGARIYQGEIFYNGGGYDIAEWIASGPGSDHDQHSLAYLDPKFKSFPAFAAKISQTGTTSRIYLEANTNPLYDHTFEIGDHVEYAYNKTMRIVTGVGSDYIDVSPVLGENSKTDETVVNWKSLTDVNYDLSLQGDSPLIDQGVNLSSKIGNLDKNGLSRPQGAAWDIGAYEYPGADVTAPASPAGLSVI